jgi:hypothetical protein
LAFWALQFGLHRRFAQAAVLGVIIALIALAVTAIAFRLGNRHGYNGARIRR